MDYLRKLHMHAHRMRFPIGVAFASISLLAANISFAQTITDAEKMAFERGVLSGQADRCGLDWENLNFRPLMRFWRARGKTEKQMSVIAAMHGAGQGYAPNLKCTSKNVKALKKQLRFSG